ncbi:MAG: hypothetical protein V8S69_02935 [Dakarella massiliensis]
MTANNRAHRSHTPEKACRSGDAGGVDGPAKRRRRDSNPQRTV